MAQTVNVDGIEYHLENGEAYLYFGNDSLEYVTLPGGIKYNNEVFPVTTIMRGAFMRSPALRAIIIPETVTTIGEMAFYECPQLRYVEIKGTVETLRTSTFSYCTALEDVHLTNVQETRAWVFEGCTSLTSISLPQGLVKIGEGTFGHCENLKHVELPESLDEICDWAFAYTAIDTIYIPSKVDKIGIGILAGDNELKGLIVDNNNPIYTSADGSNVIIEKALHLLVCGCCTSTIPEGVNTIGEVAFWKQYNLQNITLPTSLKYIEQDAFYQCVGLKELSIPIGVKKIGSMAFGQCTSLKNVSVGKRTKIAKTAFPKECKIQKKNKSTK